MLGDRGQKPIDTSTPNTRYEVKNLGTWSSIEDVDDFLYFCCHETGYYGASIGSTITINDGTYNKEWVIAGFDMEHNHQASDGNIKDNGYGICLIPKKSLGKERWNNIISNGYNGSAINTSTLPTVANNLKRVLGSHLIERNVLLSNSIDGNGNNATYYANSYTWTTAYCTLMSMGQVTGTFASNRNKYDDGEANYKLPLFNYETWSFDEWAWLRGIYGKHYDEGFVFDGIIYGLNASGDSVWSSCSNSHGLRPLIYIR